MSHEICSRYRVLIREEEGGMGKAERETEKGEDREGRKGGQKAGAGEEEGGRKKEGK